MASVNGTRPLDRQTRKHESLTRRSAYAIEESSLPQLWSGIKGYLRGTNRRWRYDDLN